MNSLLHKCFDKTNRIIVWVLVTAIICGISMLTSYYPLWANIPFNVLIPIGLLLFFPMVFFEKLKLSTLLLLRALIIVAAVGLIPGNIYVTIALVFLVINILEATLTDFKIKKYFNVVSGLALAITIVFLRGVWLGRYRFDGMYEANAAIAIGTITWWIAYTIWNWIFVTNEFSPSIALLHVGILLSPLVSVLITGNPGFWLIFRANSLTFGGVLQIANKEFFETKFASTAFERFVARTKKNDVQIACMIVNVLLVGVTAFVYFAQ